MCPYMGKSPGSGEPIPKDPPGTPPPGSDNGDPKENVTYLKDRIHQLEQYHHRLDEEDKIRQLECQLHDLEQSAKNRSEGRASFTPRIVDQDPPGKGGDGPPRQPSFPAPDQQESPTCTPDEHGRVKRSNSKFQPDYHLNLQKSMDKYTFQEYLLGCLFVSEALVADGRLWQVICLTSDLLHGKGRCREPIKLRL